MTKVLVDKAVIEQAIAAIEVQHYSNCVVKLREALAAQAVEPEPFEVIPPTYHADAMGCGLEDRGIRDRYEAMQHGWDCAIERFMECLPEKIYEHPAPAAKPCILSQEHSDNAAVDKFADAMKDKLSQARDKGRGGWESCSEEALSKMLRDHVEKGDPRDVANFCMFIHTLGYRIAPAPAAKPLSDEQILLAIEPHISSGKRGDLLLRKLSYLEYRAVISEFCKQNGIKEQS